MTGHWEAEREFRRWLENPPSRLQLVACLALALSSNTLRRPDPTVDYLDCLAHAMHGPRPHWWPEP